jgi:hypothetical protein
MAAVLHADMQAQKSLTAYLSQSRTALALVQQAGAAGAAALVALQQQRALQGAALVQAPASVLVWEARSR